MREVTGIQVYAVHSPRTYPVPSPGLAAGRHRHTRHHQNNHIHDKSLPAGNLNQLGRKTRREVIPVWVITAIGEKNTAVLEPRRSPESGQRLGGGEEDEADNLRRCLNRFSAKSYSHLGGKVWRYNYFEQSKESRESGSSRLDPRRDCGLVWPEHRTEWRDVCWTGPWAPLRSSSFILQTRVIKPFFLAKDQTVVFFGFVGHTVFVSTTQCCIVMWKQPLLIHK